MDKKQTQSENHPNGSGMFHPHPPNKPREGHRGNLSPLRSNISPLRRNISTMRGIYSDLITKSSKSLQQVKHSFSLFFFCIFYHLFPHKINEIYFIYNFRLLYPKFCIFCFIFSAFHLNWDDHLLFFRLICKVQSPNRVCCARQDTSPIPAKVRNQPIIKSKHKCKDLLYSLYFLGFWL